MVFFVDVFKTFVGDMGIDLSGGNGGMAEHFLNSAEVNALGEKISGVRMAKSVRRGVDGQAGEFYIVLNNSFD